MSYQQQRMHPQNRFTELLDALKNEFDSVSNEASVIRMHKDDFDVKFSQQTAEMQQIKQVVHELEINHRKMKEAYEEEIAQLKRELESRGPPQIPPQQGRPQPSLQQQQNVPGSEQQPPALGRSNSNVFGGIMSGSNSMTLPQQPPPPQQQIPPQGPMPSQNSGPNGTYPYQANGYPSGGPAPSNQLPSVSSATAGNNNNPILSPGSKKRPDPANGASTPVGPGSGNAPSTSSTTTNTPAPTAASIASNANTGSNGNSNGNNKDLVTSTPPQPQTQAQLQQQAEALGNIFGEIDSIRPEFKKKKDDWFVVYNERAPALLDVDLVHNLPHDSVVCCVRFSLDGRYVATGCNRTAQIYDVNTGELVTRLEDKNAERDGDLYIRSVCFSPDGKYLATGAEDKLIRVWDIKSATIRYVFPGHEQDIYSLDFSLNGRTIASGSGDRTVRIWEMENGKCVLTLSISDGVTTVAISPDGRYVAAGSLDKIVRVWDAQTGFLVERLEFPDGHKDSVYSVAFTPDGKDLVSGSLDKTIKLWELQAPRNAQSTNKGGVCVKTFIGHKDFVLSVASTPDGKWILSGSKDRGVQFWDPVKAQVQLMLQGHKNSVISVAPSPTGGLFATGSGDCRARIWKYFNRN